jgi:hypothetical protein
MLKIRTVILALSLAPLLSVTWQLPNQAQVTGPSKGPAGSASGSVGNGSNGTIFTVPPVIIQIGVPNTPNVTVLGNGSLFIPVPIQTNVNTTAINIINTGNTLGGNIIQITQIFLGNPGGVTNIQNINIRLVNIGIPQRFAGRFSRSLLGLFRRGGTASALSLPVAQLPQESLLANTKALKPGFTLAQEADSQKDIWVDVNQLNEAISAYNDIIRESSPVALQQLAQNEEFLAIGKALKELRAAIN